AGLDPAIATGVDACRGVDSRHDGRVKPGHDGTNGLSMRVLAIVMFALLVAAPAHAQLRGHGGPVRALAVSDGGARGVPGSFDSSAIVWSLPRAAAERVLRFHAGVVNAVALLADGRIATAGQDQRVALWRPDAEKPDSVLEGHGAPVVALA